jgi:hypothetical protein
MMSRRERKVKARMAQIVRARQTGSIPSFADMFLTQDRRVYTASNDASLREHRLRELFGGHQGGCQAFEGNVLGWRSYG